MLTANSDKDWFFLCASHLSDRSFCQPVLAPTPPPAPPSKPAPAKPTPKPTTDKDKDKDKDAKEETQTATATATTTQKPTPPQAPTPTPTPAAKPKEYILDRKIFFLREDAYRKKVAASKAKQIASMMPSVPRSFQ